jgi:hypothetical protein
VIIKEGELTFFHKFGCVILCGLTKNGGFGAVLLSLVAIWIVALAEQIVNAGVSNYIIKRRRASVWVCGGYWVIGQ